MISAVKRLFQKKNTAQILVEIENEKLKDDNQSYMMEIERLNLSIDQLHENIQKLQNEKLKLQLQIDDSNLELQEENKNLAYNLDELREKFKQISEIILTK